MFWGEHLSADEQTVTCPCGVPATEQLFDRYKQFRGWYCQRCARRVNLEFIREEKLAKAIVKKGLR